MGATNTSSLIQAARQRAEREGLSPEDTDTLIAPLIALQRVQAYTERKITQDD